MDKIATDNPFTDAQVATLTALARMMIPASAKHGVPGADDPDILGEIIVAARRDAEIIGAGLDDANSRAEAQYDTAFSELPADHGKAIVDALQDASPQFVRAIVVITVQCYYRDARVMTSLGMEPRPPFPKGFEVAQGDWSLLEPVRARGKVWRDAR